MYVCILNGNGNKVCHKNIPSFLQAIAPFREGMVVGVECSFCWYWLADLCQAEGIEFVLGHTRLVKGQKSSNGKVYGTAGGWIGEAKAPTIVAKRLGTAVHYLLKRKEPFNEHKLLGLSAMPAIKN